MKKILSIILIIISCLFYRISAQNPVSEAESKTVAVRYAQSFLQYKNLSPSNIVSVDSYDKNAITLMREVVFDNGLSILLSAYKSCLPVLLYSTNNTPILSDIENIPYGLRDFIENYEGALAYACEDNNNLNEHPGWTLLLNTDLSNIATRSGHVYGPLLTTQWGQENSNYGGDCTAYNHFVDSTKNSCSCDTCPTGCVATAMAQIMKYWNYPVYMPNKMEQYDWCNMPDELICQSNPNYTVERNAVARLMADCGKAAKMKYCRFDCESFAWPIDARNGLVDTFGYHSDAIRRLRSSHTTKKWKEMLIEDLSAGRPVLYAGTSWKTDDYEWGGHAFVCDGYNENTDKFHFNWGDYGNNIEIWCTIDSIIEGNHNWNHLERAVFNIYPNATQDYCNFEMPLWLHYYTYYSVYGYTTPDPYANVPKTFTRLTSVPNDSQFQPSWRTIPAGATSEYVAHEQVLLQNGFLAEAGSNFYAHIEPCESCEDGRTIEGTSDVVGTENDNPTDTLPALKSLQAEISFANDRTLTVYPNPADDILYVELSGAGIANITLYDLQGRVVGANNDSPLQGTATLNVRNVPAGVYVLRVTDTNGKEYHRKVVVD